MYIIYTIKGGNIMRYRIFMPDGTTLEAATPEELGVLIGDALPIELQTVTEVTYQITGPLSRRMLSSEAVVAEYNE